jgi:hypothetical protein
MTYINQFDVGEAIVAGIIDGLRSGSWKQGVLLALSDGIVNMIPAGNSLTSSEKNYIFEPIGGAVLYTIGRTFIGKKSSYMREFLAALVELEAAAAISMQIKLETNRL